MTFLTTLDGATAAKTAPDFRLSQHGRVVMDMLGSFQQFSSGKSLARAAFDASPAAKVLSQEHAADEKPVAASPRRAPSPTRGRCSASNASPASRSRRRPPVRWNSTSRWTRRSGH